MYTNTPHLILASASIGRKMLFEKLGNTFTIMVSGDDEDEINDTDPYRTLELRAVAKGEDVVRKISRARDIKIQRNKNIKQNVIPDLLVLRNVGIRDPDSEPLQDKQTRLTMDSRLRGNDKTDILVLACDSGAILENEMYGKPRDNDHAFEILNKLQGKTHILTTSLQIYFIGHELTIPKTYTFMAKTAVTMRPLNDDEIRSYINHYDLSKFAGCYALNETPWDFITEISGSFTNVIGLPFEELLPVLREYSLVS